MGQKTRDEAADLLRQVLTLLLGVPVDGTTQGAATLRREVGALSALAESAIRSGAISAPLQACFAAATAAGATQPAMGRVRAAVQALSPTSRPARVVRALAIRFCLVEEARFIAATTFASQDDANATLAAMNAAFSAAQDEAAGTPTNAIYRALVALHAAVTRDLTERARLLPRRVVYAFAEALPALTLANRFYADAERADELRDGNRAFHPLFLPLQVQALTA
ncbi:hypothetical protein [Methylobacterium durans]|uniref:Uncharacterized protein n=1 Tax=Methylobacterium durans TaxID=2202825 RepID=A0A2U8WC39_9HYPH|nr:hypothetical protein [Methylobacterium durans]AWN43171.1 hypothetical protein DK389_25085 [Methylobacterium durans]